MSSVSAQDAFEPDNSIATASTIVADVLQARSLDSGDEDYIKFDALNGHAYQYFVNNIADGMAGLFHLALYHTNGADLIANLDNQFSTNITLIDSVTNTGTYYLRTYTNASATGAYELTVTDLLDAYEPDDTLGAATNVPVGTSQSKGFHTMFDVDYIKFTALSNHAYEIAATNMNPYLLGSSYLTLYQTNGTSVMAAVDNTFFPGDLFIQTFVETGGVYYAKMEAPVSMGSYKLSVVDHSTGDVWEVDNTVGLASNLLAGTSQTNRDIHWGYDGDWVRVTNSPRTVYEIGVTNVGATLDAIVTLCDADGALLLSINNTGAGGDESVDFVGTGIVTNFVGIGCNGSAATGSYHLFMADRSAGGDPYEVDNHWTYASNIVMGASQTDRTIHWNRDIDYIVITSQVGHLYGISVTNLNVNLDAAVSFCDSNGTILSTMDNDVAGGSEFSTNFAAVAGPHYVRVESWGSTGFYSVLVQDLGTGDVYEYDNTPASASNIVVGTAQTTHTIHWDGDEDYLKFTVQAYHRYACLVTNVSPTYRPQIALYNGEGTTSMAAFYATQVGSFSAAAPGGNAFLTNTAFADGTRYLRVLSVTGTGVYTVLVTDLGATAAADPYEADNSSAAASVLAVDTVRTNHSIHLTNDTDWVKFTAQGERYYRINTENLGEGLDTILYLYDGNGTSLLASNNNYSGFASTIEYKITNAGTYYAKVEAAGGASVGPYSLRLTDMRLRTKWTLNHSIYSSPAVGDDGSVYVGTWMGNRLYALNLDGTTIRTWNLPAGVNASPTIHTNGGVYMGVSQGGGTQFYSFNTNGTTNWTANVLGRVYATAAIGYDGTMYVGQENIGLFFSLTPDGLPTTNWTRNTGAMFNDVCSPVIATNGAILVGVPGAGYLYSYNPNGTTNWKCDFFGLLDAPLAIDSNGMALAATSDGKLYRIDAANGTTNFIWQAEGSGNESGPVIAPDGTIYRTTYAGLAPVTGRLYSLRADGGTNWVDLFTDRIQTTPAIGRDGTIYLGCNDNKFYALNPDGTTNYVWQLNEDVTGSPTIDTNGMVYVGTANWTLYAMYGTGYGQSGGLAEDCWPMFQHDAKHTGARHPPASPGMTASDGAYTDKIRLAWQSATNATGYQVWRSLTSSSSNAVFVAQTALTNYDDVSAPAGVAYYYWIKSKAHSGVSGFSPPDTGWRAMDPPTGLSAGDGTFTDRVAVTWGSVTGASSYRIWRNTTGGTNGATLLATATNAAFSDTSAIPGTLYYFWAQASNAFEMTSFGSTDTGWRALSPPGAVTAGDGTFTDKVTIAWGAATGAAGYVVFRGSLGATGTAVELAATTALAVDDTSAAAGATNFYWVKATNTLGVSGFSASDSGYMRSVTETPTSPPPGTVPAAPTGVTAGDGTYSDRIVVGWNAVSNASGYEVWRHVTNETAGATRVAAGITATNYEDSAVTQQQVYYYWIKATNVAGASGFSDPDSGYAGTSGGAVGGGTAVNDYDGDGISDLAVFDNATAGWYVRSMAGSNIAWAVPWGWTGALPVPGDYDGDGQGDLAVFDGNSGAWYVQSVSGTTIAWAVQWGWLGALPVPGDYDGDGAGDYPVFDQDTGNWYILSASGSNIIAWATLWGWPGALPVPGDYDGDGVSDLAVYDADSGRWFVESVSGTLLAWSVEWGGATLNPVSGDFDGDGRSDLAVFDQGTGIWFIRTMAGEILAWAWAWGWPGASALAGDYDGDGVSDAVAYDSNVGTWYIGTLTNTVLGWAVLWGGPGFVPVEE